MREAFHGVFMKNELRVLARSRGAFHTAVLLLARISIPEAPNFENILVVVKEFKTKMLVITRTSLASPLKNEFTKKTFERRLRYCSMVGAFSVE